MLGEVIRYVQFVCAAFCACAAFTVVGIISWILPSLANVILSKMMEKGGVTTVTGNDMKETFFTWNLYKTAILTIYRAYVECRAYEGCPAPNPPVYDLDGTTQYHLLDFAKKDRPLVVNFGSCS